MSTLTLQDLRKQSQFATTKALAAAYGCSASKMGMILQGRYHRTITKDEVVQLAALFEVPFESCVSACNASWSELKKRNKWSEYDAEFESLQKRWEWEETVRKGAEEAAKTNDWSFFTRFSFNYQDETGKHWNSTGSTQNDASGSTRWYTTITPVSSCYAVLGVSQDATETEIKRAFRAKVKLAHKGNGDYAGDMDKLTKAKEQALANLAAKV